MSNARCRPRDPAELAHTVGQIATGEIPNDKDEILDPPQPAGPAKGGATRAKLLTPTRRRAIAKQGAAARWGNR